MFLRIFRPAEEKELLVNIDHITKIEVKYVVPGEKGEYWTTTLKEGVENPQAKRRYTIHVAGEVIRLLADEEDRVRAAIERIYQEAIKD
jgi:autonomous glycyl radical cofactor GrcA